MMQGHRPNHDAVQRHSAGEIYPYVIVAIGGSDLRWTVIGPQTNATLRWPSHRQAVAHARWLRSH
jgi:hypothetical protein